VLDSGLISCFLRRICNPLAGIEARDLMLKVDEFMQEKRLPPRDLDYFRLGAIIAQNPNAITNIKETINAHRDVNGDLRDLDNDELDHLKNEVESPWSQPTKLYQTIAICSIGAAVQ